MSARRSTRSRPRRTWPQRIVIGTGVFVVMSCVLGATGLAYGKWKLDQLEHFDVETVGAATGEPQNFLIVGSDSREAVDPDDPDAALFLNGESSGARSDSMMVARVDPSGEHVDLLSVPRDLWVIIPGGDPDMHHRINEAFAGGRQQLIDTVEATLSVDINHYVEVDFNGFKELVGAIDGVPTYFDSAWRDENSGLRIAGEGCVTLDGSQALAYARARHLEYQDPETGEWESDPTGDLGRMNRQQLLVVNAIDEAVSLDLASPAHLNRLVNVGVDNVGVDPGFAFDDMVALAKAFSSTDSDHISRHSLPVEDYRTDGGASVLNLLIDEAQPVLNIFRGLPSDAVTEAQVAVDVMNGTGTDGQASAVADALEASGFTVSGTETAAGPPSPRTQIRYAPGSAASAALVERHLSAGAELVEDADLEPGVVQLVTGADFTTVRATARPPSPTSSTTAAPDGTTSTTSTTIGHDGAAGADGEGGIDCE